MSEQSFDTNTSPSNHELARKELEGFINNYAFIDMARLFGAEELPVDTSEKIAFLQDLAAKHWDFRKGAERQAVNWDDDLLDQEGSDQWNRIFAAANDLGMVESTKSENLRPEYLVFLGGANRAPLDRLRFGMEQVEEADNIVYLGSSRLISDAEKEKAADYAPGAETEFDLGCGAIETHLKAHLIDELKSERGGDTWVARFYEYNVIDENQQPVAKHAFALGTPQIIGKENATENQRRATTYDNFDNFARVAKLADNKDTSVVSVTTGFYVPGQHLPAVQELTAKYGTKVETIGHSAEYSGVVRKPRQLLQEMKAGIDAAARLHAYLDKS
jgi:hypothetical protein